MIEALEWVAMGTGIAAAIMVSLKLDERITGIGFVVFLVSSVCWVTIGWSQGETPLAIQNIVLSLINIVGVFRWLILRS